MDLANTQWPLMPRQLDPDEAAAHADLANNFAVHVNETTQEVLNRIGFMDSGDTLLWNVGIPMQQIGAWRSPPANAHEAADEWNAYVRSKVIRMRPDSRVRRFVDSIQGEGASLRADSVVRYKASLRLERRLGPLFNDPDLRYSDSLLTWIWELVLRFSIEDDGVRRQLARPTGYPASKLLEWAAVADREAASRYKRPGLALRKRSKAKVSSALSHTVEMISELEFASWAEPGYERIRLSSDQ